MASLRVDHPDIAQFIDCKAEEGRLSNFNISVAITDKFMEACDAGADYELVNPHTGRATASLPAREVMDMIVAAAHRNGEPGLLFIDRANQNNPLPHLYQLETTNPCGEQYLGPYENCCLGSINLALHVDKARGKILWAKLADSVRTAVRFLDDVVSVNNYIPKVPELKAAAWRARRIGLGFMGLADLLVYVGAGYSNTGVYWAAAIAEWIQYHAMLASIDLAKERGPFPAISGSVFDPKNIKWKPPTRFPPFFRDTEETRRYRDVVIGMPQINWETVVMGIRNHGIRNAAFTTVAPTGTIGTVAGVEGYGIEPMFSITFSRWANQGEGRIELKYASKLFEWMLQKWGIPKDSPEALDAIGRGSCAGDERFPEQFRDVCVTAGDIDPESHIRMQATVQHFFSNSISKTINLPRGSTREDVYKAYRMAWELGCRGITVYVAGSRETEVLVTPSAAQAPSSKQ